jgi:HK97 family phage portal protein
MRAQAARVIGGQSIRTKLSQLELLSSIRRVPPKRGTKEFLLAYSQMPRLRMVVSKIAAAMAKIEWYVEAKTTAGVQKIEDHPLINSLHAGNDIMSGFEVMKTLWLHYLIVGEWHFAKERNIFGTPIALVPLVPNWIMALPRPNRPFYHVVIPQTGFVGQVYRTEVVTHRDIDPLYPYDRGSGAAMALEDELNADELAARYAANYFMNNARPDIIVTGSDEQPLLDTERKRLEEVWVEKFSGVKGAGKPLFSSGSLTVKELSATMREMQFKDLRELEEHIIVTTYGVPPEMVGILANSNRATIDSADYLFTKEVIRPLCVGARETLQKSYVPDFDERLRLHFVDPVPADAEGRRASMNARPWAFKVDEHREEAGFDELPNGEGKVFMMPYTMTPAEKPMDALGETHGSVPAEQDPKDPGAKKAFVKGNTPKPHEFDAILDAVDPATLVRASKDTMKALIAEFGASAVDDIGMGISFDLTDPAVGNFLERFAADRLTGKVNETTRRQIGDALSEVWHGGGTTDDMIAAIKDVFDEASDSRAELIAGTETNRAANFATQTGFEQAGIPAKEWLSTRDDLVRDTKYASHVQLDGQVVGVDEDFEDPVSGARAAYPGEFGDPAEDCNCRCGIVPVFRKGQGEEDDGKSYFDTEQKRVTHWKARERRKAPFERQLTAELRGAFAIQRRAAIAALKRAALKP